MKLVANRLDGTHLRDILPDVTENKGKDKNAR